MRKEDINKLSEPYKNDDEEIHRRFNSAIGADVPSVGKLADEIFNDLDTNLFGISWWSNMPTEERILVSDHLYQCVNSIETNLVEAKLHFMEWLDARERTNIRIADAIVRSPNDKFEINYPRPNAPIDELSGVLESLHLCGFFRAIASTLDCLGGAIIGVLALPSDLRKADIGNAELAFKDKTRKKINPSLSKLQLDFLDLYQTAKQSSGAEGWLEWAVQYRNMYVHRGRRTIFHTIVPRENLFYDSNERVIPRAESKTHLAKYPARTDIEAFIKAKDINLNEDAETTLNGIFKSSREFTEIISEKLLLIWKERRTTPTLLEQPQIQWNSLAKNCNFEGYDSTAEPINSDRGLGNPILPRRMLSASVFDHQRKFWENSKWKT